MSGGRSFDGEAKGLLGVYHHQSSGDGHNIARHLDLILFDFSASGTKRFSSQEFILMIFNPLRMLKHSIF